jgi:hypothetical protein
MCEEEVEIHSHLLSNFNGFPVVFAPRELLEVEKVGFFL